MDETEPVEGEALLGFGLDYPVEALRAAAMERGAPADIVLERAATYLQFLTAPVTA